MQEGSIRAPEPGCGAGAAGAQRVQDGGGGELLLRPRPPPPAPPRPAGLLPPRPGTTPPWALRGLGAHSSSRLLERRRWDWVLRERLEPAGGRGRHPGRSPAAPSWRPRADGGEGAGSSQPGGPGSLRGVSAGSGVQAGQLAPRRRRFPRLQPRPEREVPGAGGRAAGEAGEAGEAVHLQGRRGLLGLLDLVPRPQASLLRASCGEAAGRGGHRRALGTPHPPAGPRLPRAQLPHLGALGRPELPARGPHPPSLAFTQPGSPRCLWNAGALTLGPENKCGK
ncbi:hypothetical protein VULLAG_LOCUS4297 [Vulpes lagopus]